MAATSPVLRGWASRPFARRHLRELPTRDDRHRCCRREHLRLRRADRGDDTAQLVDRLALGDRRATGRAERRHDSHTLDVVPGTQGDPRPHLDTTPRFGCRRRSERPTRSRRDSHVRLGEARNAHHRLDRCECGAGGRVGDGAGRWCHDPAPRWRCRRAERHRPPMVQRHRSADKVFTINVGAAHRRVAGTIPHLVARCPARRRTGSPGDR